MRKIIPLLLFLAGPVFAQDVDIAMRPDAVYIETLAGNIVPMERMFFHIVIENKTAKPVEVEWVRFDIANSRGMLFSGQYSGQALTDLFDSSIDRRRIETTAKQTLIIEANERKAISDIFMDLPSGFIGDNMILELNYKSGGRSDSKKTSIQLRRMQAFAGRLPFEGTWYVAAEHSYLDAHKRFLAEAYAYDFLQIGPGGKSYQRDGRSNSDYYAYGKKVLAAKDGRVVSVRGDMAENAPGETTNTEAPGGNLVIIDHGGNQFGYYAHLKPFTVAVKPGAQVKAGDVLGEVGNSGDSSEPHLHFHVMNNADPSLADGIPVVFESWKAQSYTRVPQARQPGILPRGEFVHRDTVAAEQEFCVRVRLALYVVCHRLPSLALAANHVSLALGRCVRFECETRWGGTCPRRRTDGEPAVGRGKQCRRHFPVRPPRLRNLCRDGHARRIFSEFRRGSPRVEQNRRIHARCRRNAEAGC